MPHSQGFSNKPNSTQFLLLIYISLSSILILSSHLSIGLPKCFFPIELPVKSLKALLPSSILATCPAQAMEFLIMRQFTLLIRISSIQYNFQIGFKNYYRIIQSFSSVAVFASVAQWQEGLAGMQGHNFNR